MKRKFLLFSLLVSGIGFADTLLCRAAGEQNDSMLVMNAPLENVKSASWNPLFDTLPVETYGAIRIRKDGEKTSFTFQNTIEIDWAAIDPNKQCYVSKPQRQVVLNPDYTGTIRSFPNLVMHPKQLKPCPIPHPIPGKEKKLTCKSVTLEFQE